jgi:hypothetical protein
MADTERIKIVNVEKPNKRYQTGMAVLEVTLQAKTVDELNSLDAKQMAYEVRTDHGMADAGIEPIGGSMAIDIKTGKSIPTADIADISNNRVEDIAYQRTFKLTQMI